MRERRTTPNSRVRRRFRAGDRLASWTEGSYTYNAAGCVTQIVREGSPTLDLTWNGQYQLVSVSTNGVFAESYAYDALGRRVSTTTQEGTVRHVYDDSWQCLADIDETGNVLRSSVWGEGIDKLLAIRIGGNVYYPLTDIQGTVWGYADSANNVVACWMYDAWGNVLSEYCAVPTLASVRYRFQGRERSAVTGLINFRMRWYDAETGRWLSKDPIGLGGGLNLYVFCENEPVMNSDLTGCVRDTVDGINMEIHKCDPDPWPSKPHAHDLNNPHRKISTDGSIWNTKSKRMVGKISKKALPRLASFFAKAMGAASLFLSATTFGDSTIYPGMSGPGPVQFPSPPVPSTQNPPLLWLQ